MVMLINRIFKSNVSGYPSDICRKKIRMHACMECTIWASHLN